MPLTIKNAGDRATVDLYGVIGDDYDGITAEQFSKELAQIPAKQPIELHINSPGGSYFDGVAMHAKLTQRKGDVYVIVDGLAASAGSLVAMAGKTIEMSKYSKMMIHEANGGIGEIYGRAGDFRAAAEKMLSYADRLDATNRDIVEIYSSRWNGTQAELRAALDAETWLSAEDAIGVGLADSVSDSMAIAACFDPKQFGYRNAPQALTSDPSPRILSMRDKLEQLKV